MFQAQCLTTLPNFGGCWFLSLLGADGLCQQWSALIALIWLVKFGAAVKSCTLLGGYKAANFDIIPTLTSKWASGWPFGRASCKVFTSVSLMIVTVVLFPGLSSLTSTLNTTCNTLNVVRNLKMKLTKHDVPGSGCVPASFTLLITESLPYILLTWSVGFCFAPYSL